MSNTHTWSVVQMTCCPQYEGRSDVVFQVLWMCQASNGASPIPVTATQSGYASLTLDPSSPFTPYADLTQEQVLGWVYSSLGAEGVANVESNLDLNITTQITPPVVQPPLPWATPTA